MIIRWDKRSNYADSSGIILWVFAETAIVSVLVEDLVEFFTLRMALAAANKMPMLTSQGSIIGMLVGLTSLTAMAIPGLEASSVAMLTSEDSVVGMQTLEASDVSNV